MKYLGAKPNKGGNMYEWRIEYRNPFYILQRKVKFLFWKYWQNIHFSHDLSEVEYLYKISSHASYVNK